MKPATVPPLAGSTPAISAAPVHPRSASCRKQLLTLFATVSIQWQMLDNSRASQLRSRGRWAAARLL